MFLVMPGKVACSPGVCRCRQVTSAACAPQYCRSMPIIQNGGTPQLIPVFWKLRLLLRTPGHIYWSLFGFENTQPQEYTECIAEYWQLSGLSKVSVENSSA